MKVYVLFYDDGDIGPHCMIGIYKEKETAEADIIPNAEKYGNGYQPERYAKYFYIEEMEVL